MNAYDQEPNASRPELSLEAAHARRVRLNQCCWALWIVGTLLVLGSWFELVSADTGWIGYGVGALGGVFSWALASLPYKRHRDCCNEPVDD